MIDWITARIPLVHTPIKSGVLTKSDHHGEIEFSVSTRRQTEGSYSANISVDSDGSDGQGNAEFLLISGNPSKFLQGHNIIGSDDHLSLMHDTLKLISKNLELFVPQSTYELVLAGDWTISRIDINYSFTLNNQHDVQHWLRMAEFKSRTRAGRPVNKSGSIYWGSMKAPRWQIVAYSKLLEITKGKKPLPLDLMRTPLKQWTENVLRVELRLKRLELRERELNIAKNLKGRIPQLFNEYLERIVMNENYRIEDKRAAELPQCLRSTYNLWNLGFSMKDEMTKATFYKHRKKLLEFGVDISISKNREQQESNVIPLIRVLEAQPARIPEWAFTDGLVHHSTKQIGA